MENSKIKHIFHEFVQRFELYLGCVLFLAMMVLLTIQVCSRYLGNAITWTEELSCIMLVWMSYLGFAGAITSRKHLRIDAFINSRSFKVNCFQCDQRVVFRGSDRPHVSRDCHVSRKCGGISDPAHSKGGFLQHSAVQHGPGHHPYRAGVHPSEQGRGEGAWPR